MILSIDAGKFKLGYAIVDKGKVYDKGILPIDSFKKTLPDILKNYKVNDIVIGNGTGHKEIVDFIEHNYTGIRLHLVGEKHTSVEAKYRYIDSLKGFKRIFFKTFGYADKPFDDYAALIIAERFLRQNERENTN